MSPQHKFDKSEINIKNYLIINNHKQPNVLLFVFLLFHSFSLYIYDKFKVNIIKLLDLSMFIRGI